MRFGVLGPLAVWTAVGKSITVPGAKVRALLADLLIHRGHVVSADRLVDDLWGDETPANPTAALQVKVSQLRRTLAQAGPGGRELVASRSPGYLLQVDADAVDAGRFAALTERARLVDDPRRRAALLTDALALWRGPPFADLGDEPFVLAATGRLEEDRLVALEDLAEARLALGEHHPLVGVLAELVADHPYRERLRAAHLRALYASGRQREALESYDDLKNQLLDQLGLDPSPDLVALRQSILEQDPALRPPPRATRPLTNLPVPATDLVGRDGAITEVRGLLQEERLVTLAGMGGVGKTRLALETASQMVDAFPEGVWLVELTALEGGSGCGPEASVADMVLLVGEVLGIRDEGSGRHLPGSGLPGLLERLVDALRDQRMLLVLDNCEHVVDAVAELCETLLGAAPGLRILATSQESLRMPGERLWIVPPLELPATDAEPAALQESTAVQLFVARAAASAPGFALDHDNAAAVASICRRLDGVPLALELAATRVRALGVDELAARLDDRFRLLAAGKRGAPTRQQTLRAMIDWSWELLSEPERLVLRRLAVHVDGCALDAAEVVCSGDCVDSHDVLDQLAALVNRSLVVPATNTGELRYRLLESVAAYGIERLVEAGELDELRRRHARYYTDLAERAEPHLRSHTQRQWLARLDTDAANFRHAIEEATGAGDPALALQLVNALGWYWFLNGRLGEGRRMLKMALDTDGYAPACARARAAAWHAGFTLLARDVSDPLGEAVAAIEQLDQIDDPFQRARSEWFLGYALFRFGDLSTSGDLVERALAGCRTLGDRWGIAAALVNRSELAIFRGDLAALERDGKESAALFDELGDRWGKLRAKGILAELGEVTGDYEQATRLQRAGLEIAEELGLWTDVSYRLSGLGRLAVLVGDYGQAETYHERARQLARERSNKAAEQFAELGLGLGARRQGKLDEAEAYLGKMLDANRQIDGHAGLPLILAELGFIAELRSDAKTAAELHLDSFKAASAAQDPRAVALALEGLAGARALAGRHDLAAQLLGAAGTVRERLGAPLPASERGDVDRIAAASRGALGGDAFAVAYRRGADVCRQGPLALDDLAAPLQGREPG